MSINREELTSTFLKMRDLFVADPTNAVRSKSFITAFQDYCEYELRARNLEVNGFHIEKEWKIEVERGRVEADVGIFDKDNQPVLIVDVRSQMSSLGKNFNNYIRMKAGEVESVHKKYPNCVDGLVYIHPAGDLKTNGNINPVGVFNYSNAVKQLGLLSGRKDANGPASLFEQVAYCIIDFNSPAPKLSDIHDVLDLQLENFFDNLADTLKERTNID